MVYDKSGWRAKLNSAMTVLNVALSVAVRLPGGGRLKARRRQSP